MIKKYFINIFIIIIVFLVGVFLGNTMNQEKNSEITTLLKESELNTESYLIEQEFIKEISDENCEIAQLRIKKLSNELWELGKVLEESLDPENYNTLKRKFHLMQINTYTMMKKIQDKCEINQNVVLYYFDISNSSKKQGEILDKLVKNYNVTVFAIEYNYSKDISFLEEYYNITQAPSIILDYAEKFNGLTEYDILESAIN